MTNHIFSIVNSQLSLLYVQTLGVTLGVVVAIVIIGLILLLRRISILKNQKADLQRQVHERSELLEYSAQNEKRAKEMAAQANQTKSALLVRINHEIRTPLNGILGMASLLAETPLSSEQQEYSDTIRECGDSLLKVVNDILLKDILDFSKLEAGKVELEQKDFSLENSLEEVLEVFGSKAAKNGIELVYHLDQNVPTEINGDKMRLGQVLMNLVENSVRHTSSGEILINVAMSATGEANAVELSFQVKDTGGGIGADQLKALTNNLHGLSSGSLNKANGVGLIISKKLVELMGGTIKVESEAGKGTAVTFTIRTVASIQSKAIKHGLDSLKGKKILVVEDNINHVNFIKDRLVEWNLVPLIVHSGKDALAKLAETSDVELALIDNLVLDMDGVTLAQSIKEKYAQLPMILLSPKDEANVKNHAELFDAVIFKPIKKHILSKQILSCFRHLGRSANDDKSHKLSAKFSEEHPLRILIAEDNVTNQKLAMKVLGKLGYKPDVAQHGKEVLEIVSNKNYDVILMDVQMPVMDGLEASRMIRMCLSVQPVIIAMTANTLQGDREACLQAGMDDYLSKPINLEELVDVLEKWAINIREKIR
jgi:signal transduction histidine kinase/DNA-binding response OmpR family regulator